MSSRSQKKGATPSAAVVQQAAEWLVRLSADDLTPSARNALQLEFENWQRQNAAHASAARTMQAMIQQTQQAANVTNTKHAHVAIEASLMENKKQITSRRQLHGKNLAKTLIWVLCLFLPLWLALEIYPPAYLLADAHTATGEWHSRTLTDGSHITLGSSSAVNLAFDSDQRKLELIRGEILVEVATDPQRPFRIITPHGDIRALGTRFIVSLDEQVTMLTMLESRTAVRTTKQRADVDEVIVDAGQRLRFSSLGIGEIEEIDARVATDAWRLRQLIVENHPLPEVLDALAHHRRGMIYFDRDDLSQMNVSAVLPLEDTDRALQLLASGFPIRINRITPWLIVVEAR